MKTTALLFAILALYSSCSKIDLAGYEESKTFDAGDFNKIEAHGSIGIVFSDTVDHIIATADANALPHLKVELSNQTLKLGYPNININCRTVVIVPFKSGLKQLTLSGASSFITEKAIETDDLKLELSGASEIVLSGFAKEVDVSLSGASEIKAVKDGNVFTFACDELEGELSGACSVQIHCKDKIDCNLSGASTILYTGNADPGSCNCSGASNVTKL